MRKIKTKVLSCSYTDSLSTRKHIKVDENLKRENNKIDKVDNAEPCLYRCNNYVIISSGNGTVTFFYFTMKQGPAVKMCK